MMKQKLKQYGLLCRMERAKTTLAERICHLSFFTLILTIKSIRKISLTFLRSVFGWTRQKRCLGQKGLEDDNALNTFLNCVPVFIRYNLVPNYNLLTMMRFYVQIFFIYINTHHSLFMYETKLLKRGYATKLVRSRSVNVPFSQKKSLESFLTRFQNCWNSWSRQLVVSTGHQK